MARGEDSNEIHSPPTQNFPMPTPFGTLVVIPAEIRLKIYRPLIERGQLAILRTSRAINNEASENLYQKATCRARFNYYIPIGIYPSRVPWSSIQTLELRVKVTDYGNESCIIYFNDWLQRFSAHMTDLKVCKIRLDFRPELCFFDPELFTAISTLTALQKVVFVIAVNPDRDATPIRYRIGPPPDLDRDMYLDMHCETYEDSITAYEWSGGYLERALGRPEWFEDEKGMHLEFYPQQRAIGAIPMNENEILKEEEEEGEEQIP